MMPALAGMKRPRLTPFMLYYIENKPSVSRELSPLEVSRLLAEQWRAMPSDRIKDYCLLANSFSEAVEKYGPGPPPQKRKKERRERKKRDPREPKPCASAFVFFSRHHRGVLKAENSELSFGDLGKTVGLLWKAATPEDKQPFEEMAALDKARYAREKADYDRWVATQSQLAQLAKPDSPKQDDSSVADSAIETGESQRGDDVRDGDVDSIQADTPRAQNPLQQESEGVPLEETAA
jgi:hypothetical protein